MIRHHSARGRRAAGVLAGALAIHLALAGCSTPQRLAAVPDLLTMKAQAAVPDARYYPERKDPAFARVVLESNRKEIAWLAQNGHTGPLPPANYLSISGGGGDGAFAAGFLEGWTQTGERPAFKLVTGVSTGALIAPYAFLGPSYDGALRRNYTTISDQDIFKKRNFMAPLFSDAMSDTKPMAKLVDLNVTQELLDAIAVEYAKGRLLFIATTNLDSREPVFWNMGLIASSHAPGALALFRKITLASAAVPAAFPPVMIDVTVDGVHYQEMHVDGGATRQVFMYPRSLHLADVAATEGGDRQRAVYILRNARLDPDWAKVDRRIMSIVGRSLSSLIQTQGMGDLYRMYLTASRDHLDYNLAYIPDDFTVPKRSEFDRAYMTALFERGRQLGAGGYPWAKYPPGYDPKDTTPVH